LTNFQQRQLDKVVKSGDTLPSACPPTSSSKPRGPPKKKVVGKVLNPRNYSSHTRSRQQIESSGAYEREQFQPAPLTKYNGVYEKDKVRLANMMAYGEDIVPASECHPSRPVRKQPKDDDQELEVDRFKELEDEIEERRGFLEQMESLGRGAEYRIIIETQISQMVREMEIIDAKRTADLQKLLASHKSAKQTT
jgi:hypothetical protein